MPESDVKQRILTEATRLFADKGYGSTSTREVVEAAGVTKPTLYYWFASKERLYLECVQAQMDKQIELVDDAVSGPGTVWERLRRFVDEYIGNAVGNEVGCRLMMTVKHPGAAGEAPEVDVLSVHIKSIEMLAEVIAEGQASGEIRSDIDPRAAVFNLVGTCNLWLVATIYGNPLPDDFVEQILDLFWTGVSPR